MGIPTPTIEAFQRAMGKAIGQQIGKAAQKAEQFVKNNEAPEQAAPNNITEKPSRPPLEGFAMEISERSTQQPVKASSAEPVANWGGLWIFAPMLGILYIWRRKHNRTPN